MQCRMSMIFFLFVYWFGFNSHGAELPGNPFAANPLSDELFQRLGLPYNATSRQIHERRKRLAIIYLPDKAIGDQSMKELYGTAMTKINEAYDVLYEPGTRTEYLRLQVVQNRLVSAGLEKAQDERQAYKSRPDTWWKKIAARQPELSALLSNWYTPRKVAGTNMQAREFGHEMKLWPSDIALVQALMATDDSIILRDTAFNLITVPGWEKQTKTLESIIEKNHPMVNAFLAEFIYHPRWVGPSGEKILHRLIDLGYGQSVKVSLGISGGIQYADGEGGFYTKGWQETEEGKRVFEHLVLNADEATLTEIDRTLMADGQSPWCSILKKDRRFESVEDWNYWPVRVVQTILQRENASKADSTRPLALPGPKACSTSLRELGD